MWLRDGLSQIKMKLWGILLLLHPFPLAWPYVPLIPQGACMRSIRKLTVQKRIAFWQFISLTWLTKGSDESQHIKRGRERMFRREMGEPGLAAASIEIVLNHCVLSELIEQWFMLMSWEFHSKLACNICSCLLICCNVFSCWYVCFWISLKTSANMILLCDCFGVQQLSNFG